MEEICKAEEKIPKSNPRWLNAALLQRTDEHKLVRELLHAERYMVLEKCHCEVRNTIGHSHRFMYASAGPKYQLVQLLIYLLVTYIFKTFSTANKATASQYRFNPSQYRSVLILQLSLWRHGYPSHALISA